MVEDRLQSVSKSLPRVDAVDKATGAAVYLADLKLPGMLCGKIKRSAHAHARISSIDASRARKVRGVRAVITADDMPPIKFGFTPKYADKYLLAKLKVRFAGEEVAAVAATDIDAAEEALALIDIDYGPLSAVFDPEEAMRPGAPLVHEDRPGNLMARITRQYGDLELGFKRADFVFEHKFATSRVNHCCLETHGCAAKFDPPGRLTVWSSSQAPHFLINEIARALGLASSKIRVIKPFVGGAFGAKMVMDMKEPIAAVLSMKTGRPVKIANSREEEFAASRYRYPMIIELRTGAQQDGKLTAKEARVLMDQGAYSHKGPAVTTTAARMFATLYRVEHLKFDCRLVHTNNLYGGAFRGFGNPQVNFAVESQMDIIADELGIDPAELRIKNSRAPGEITSSGARITSCGMSQCIMSAASKLSCAPVSISGRGIGAGLAAMVHSGGGHRLYFNNSADAYLQVLENGAINLSVGTTDVGQGADTVMVQIAAEALGLGPENVRLVVGDTAATPFDMGAFASRTTFVGGNAVRDAAEKARRLIFEAAARALEASVEDLTLRDGKIAVRGSPGKALTIQDAVALSYKAGVPITARGVFHDSLPPGTDLERGIGNFNPTYSFGSQAAELEVDAETGRVEVKKFVAAHDLGRAINPSAAAGQVEGGIAQGIGYALMENLVFEAGRLKNPNLMDYMVPTALDMPRIEVILVETIDPDGPFGAKGIGEPSLVPTAPAIANAIYRACGVRPWELPANPERLYWAIKKKVAEERGSEDNSRR